MNIADCGHGVFVGDAEACHALRPRFDLAIHVWRNSTPPMHHCAHAPAGGPDDLAVGTTEGQALRYAVGPSLDEIAAFARRPGTVLCHCAAGLCRGSTMALIALCARGVPPYEAMGTIARAIWRSYKTEVAIPGFPAGFRAPSFTDAPLNEILAKFDPIGMKQVVLIEGTDGHPAKDLRTAHAAAALLRARGLDLEVWGVSPDPTVAERYPCDRFFHAPDPTTLRRIYADSDILLKTSRFEGRPCPPVEAAACGTPTVMTDFPGSAEDLDGIVPRAPIGDAAAVASIAEGLLRDPSAMRAAQVAGLERTAGLTWDRAIDQLEAIYGLPTAATIARGTLGVLLPTRDRPHMIGRALDSLRAQTRADWRALIVVNGNRDPAGYAVALAPYLSDPRITATAIDAEGIPQALNAGLAALPPTDYIAVLEDDDEWAPDFLAATTAVLDRQSHVAMAYVDTEERGPAIPRIHCPAHGEYDNAVHRGGNWIAFPAMTWRRALIAEGGGFDETTGGACDWDTGLRLAAMGEVRRVRRPLLIHVWHESNTCANEAYMRPFADRILAKVKAGAYDRPTPNKPSTPTTEPALPSLGQRALNLGKSIVTGKILPHGDPALTAARIKVCEGCDQFRPSDRTCGSCGCFIDKKASTKDDCPLKRWPDPASIPAAVPAPAAQARPGGCGCGSKAS